MLRPKNFALDNSQLAHHKENKPGKRDTMLLAQLHRILWNIDGLGMFLSRNKKKVKSIKIKSYFITCTRVRAGLRHYKRISWDSNFQKGRIIRLVCTRFKLSHLQNLGIKINNRTGLFWTQISRTIFILILAENFI